MQYPSNLNRLTTSILIAMAHGMCSFQILADSDMDVIEVVGHKQDNQINLGTVDSLLQNQGVNFSAAGGASALPVINGMMGDRIKVLVDGADVTAACANQMNPPLSYISANQIQTLSVMAGISPVSVAGDNIAGVIQVNSINPQYGEDAGLNWLSGYISGEYRSNNEANLIGLGARLASRSMSFHYQGSYEDANSYEDGNGNLVLDSLYRIQNHALDVAVKDNKQQLAVKLSHQSIPFQGYPNQYMDMTHNRSYGVTGQYQRQLDEGQFEAQVNWHGVKHRMGFFSDEKPGMMPMETEADDYSYQLRWSLPVSETQQLNLGHEYYDYRIDDWWPAVADSMMMGPNDYININDGRRQRIALYLESEQQFSPQWKVSAGIRGEQVTTDAGEVQSYSNMGMMGMPNVDYAAAQAFNARDRERNDTLWDITLLSRYQISPNQQIELGLAQKNRAPNLYERYSWGRGVMATTMIGWFGDANGYVGDPDLKPETARTFSIRYVNAGPALGWKFSASSYYTQVNDYIDAQVIGHFNQSDLASGQRNILQFSNLDARLFGGNLNASVRLVDNARYGEWQISGEVKVTRGERKDTESSLYQIKPLETIISITQQLGDWHNALTWQWVASKDRVDMNRLENKTGSYQLLNLSSHLVWQHITFTLAATNVLDEYYELPLGGVSIAEYNTDFTSGFRQVAGAGRSINLGLSYRF